MASTPSSDDYWTVDIPGLRREHAETLVKRAEELGYVGTAIDPAHFFTLHLDRDTVENVLAALRMAAGDAYPADREAMEEWLVSQSLGSAE